MQSLYIYVKSYNIHAFFEILYIFSGLHKREISRPRFFSTIVWKRDLKVDNCGINLDLASQVWHLKMHEKNKTPTKYVLYMKSDNSISIQLELSINE